VLAPGNVLRLRYRVVAHDGFGDAAELEREAEAFAAT
jgi:hypothetical protein